MYCCTIPFAWEFSLKHAVDWCWDGKACLANALHILNVDHDFIKWQWSELASGGFRVIYRDWDQIMPSSDEQGRVLAAAS